MLAVLLFSQFIGAELQINGAKDFHSEIISQIEASNFKPSVITACKNQAKDYGYQLEIQDVKRDKLVCGGCNTVFMNSAGKCPNCESIQNVDYAKERICKVKLSYPVILKLIHVHQTGVISGYAR